MSSEDLQRRQEQVVSVLLELTTFYECTPGCKSYTLAEPAVASSARGCI